MAVVASGYAFYLMRIVELMVGSTNYASVVLTLLVLLAPVKYGLFCLHRGASGWFFLVGGMLSFYWSCLHGFASRTRGGAHIAQ